MEFAHATREDRMRAWYEAAWHRRSRRAYTGVAVPADEFEKLARSCEGFRPFTDARTVVVETPGSDVFTGIVGSYGKVTGAPHVLLVIADAASPSAQQHAGYVGEAAVLEATALGLNTCWVGGFFDTRKAARLTDLAPTERILAVSPVGTAVDAPNTTERTMTSMAGSRKRKPLDETAPGWSSWPSWAKTAAECVRVAPSAMNRQPWRLRHEPDGLVIARDSRLETPKVTRALDCGIAMLHAELGALSAGVKGSWTDMGRGLDVARFRPQEVAE